MFSYFSRRLNAPIASLVQEAQVNRTGDAPHSSWRNYDDINEYFWYDAQNSSVVLSYEC